MSVLRNATDFILFAQCDTQTDPFIDYSATVMSTKLTCMLRFDQEGVILLQFLHDYAAWSWLFLLCFPFLFLCLWCYCVPSVSGSHLHGKCGSGAGAVQSYGELLLASDGLLAFQLPSATHSRHAS